MATKSVIQDFLAQPVLAVVGVSRSGKKFGNAVVRDLKTKGYHVYIVHPQAETLEGERCYPSLKEIPEPVGGLVLVVPPAETEKLVRDAHALGIQRIWMQQGAESPQAVRFCKENEMSVVQGECIMMFFDEKPAFPHNLHKFVRKLTGSLPK